MLLYINTENTRVSALLKTFMIIKWCGTKFISYRVTCIFLILTTLTDKAIQTMRSLVFQQIKSQYLPIILLHRSRKIKSFFSLHRSSRLLELHLFARNAHKTNKFQMFPFLKCMFVSNHMFLICVNWPHFIYLKQVLSKRYRNYYKLSKYFLNGLSTQGVEQKKKNTNFSWASNGTSSTSK